MVLYIHGHRYGYELQRVAQMFCFGDKVTVVEGLPLEDSMEETLLADLCGKHLIVRHQQGTKLLFEISSEDVFPNGAVPDDEQERVFGVMIYETLSRFTRIAPPWGVLTGIRPVKLFLRRMQAGLDEKRLNAYFVQDRLLDESRFSLAYCTAKEQQAALRRSTKDSFSLYVSIPFCPSRCAYCSFVSHSVEQAAKLIPDYIEKLCEEIQQTATIAGKLGLKLRTVYFGGGTPTSISEEQLQRVMKQVATCFDLSALWEYTVEAGRPDTITQGKLELIRHWGAKRISINPQTLSDSVLRAIGRKHTVEQCLLQYHEAKKMGFAVNMDLIAGLPTDTLEGFRESVEGLIAATPENITVHTLTVKRAAQLSAQDTAEKLGVVRAMVDGARELLTKAGYLPYYLYRQSGTLSALENVGYTKPDNQCLYNIYMMDETHSVLAVGAGASTRLCHPDTGEIGRVYNYKYPYEYLQGFEEIIRRKSRIEGFFGTCNQYEDSV